MAEFNNVMVDLETMDNKPTSAIVSIGAVAFNTKELGPEFYERVDLGSSMRHGLTVSADTLIWWLGQSDEARSELMQGGKLLGLVLEEFSDFVKQFGSNVKVWGNGASFDNAILANAYHAANQELPWKFWNDSCYRTFKNMHPDVKIKREGTYHHALDDAKFQANHMIAIYGAQK